MKTTRRKRPCAVCRRWFLPDPRTHHCQRTCGTAECRRALRARTQQQWRARNPAYFADRRLRQQTDQAKTRLEKPGAGPVVTPPPRSMAKIPWEAAQDGISPEVLVFMAVLARVLHAAAQDAIGAQVLKLKGEFVRVLREARQDAMGSGVPP